MRRGFRKHLWRPGRMPRWSEVVTCEGCGAQVQRIAVPAVSTSPGVDGPKRHNLYAHHYRAAASLPWRGLWEVPPCPRTT